jgi:NTP pyrophosphatase (non-canonical NTP hydrolase)
MKEDYRVYYEKFISEWGVESQFVVAMEEMSELTKELCKYRRNEILKKDNTETIKNIKEEIADVLNMVEQLENMFGEEEIEKIRQTKLKRAIKRMKEVKNG